MMTEEVAQLEYKDPDLQLVEEMEGKMDDLIEKMNLYAIGGKVKLSAIDSAYGEIKEGIKSIRKRANELRKEALNV